MDEEEDTGAAAENVVPGDDINDDEGDDVILEGTAASTKDELRETDASLTDGASKNEDISADSVAETSTKIDNDDENEESYGSDHVVAPPADVTSAVALPSPPVAISSKSLDPDVEASFRRAFDAFDKDKDGNISIKDMIRSMNAMKKPDGTQLKVTRTEIDEMLRTNFGGNSIPYDVFLGFFKKHLDEMDQSNIVKIAFDSFDVDQDSKIGSADFKVAFNSLDMPATEWEIQELIQYADGDASGGLDEQKFTNLLNMRRPC
eukprot:g1539.t1